VTRRLRKQQRRSRTEKEKPQPDVPQPDPPRLPGGPVILWLGVAIFSLSMIAGVARSLATHSRLPPIGVGYARELSETLQGQGDSAALPLLRSAARIDYENQQAVIDLLVSARRAGDGDNIVWALETLMRLRPKDGKIRNELVTELLNQGRVIEAYEHGQVAVRLTPESSVTHCNLGAALLGLDQKREAAACYRRALELDPNSETARGALDFPLRGF
jgi:tetratricopeptide (TPR) repeat protein